MKMRIFKLILGLAAIAFLCDAAAVQRRQNNKNVPAQKRTNPAGRVNVRAPATATDNKNKGAGQGQVHKPVAAKVLAKPAQPIKKTVVNQPIQTQTSNGGVKKPQNPVKNGYQKAGGKPQQQNQKIAGVRRRRRKNAGVAARGKKLKRRRKVNPADKTDGVDKPRPVGNKNVEYLAVDGSEDDEEAGEDTADEAALLEDGEATEGEGEESDYEYEVAKEGTSENGDQNNVDSESENGNSAAEDDEYSSYYASDIYDDE